MGNYSLEQISALQPDLVLAAEINTAEQVKAMEDLGLIVFYLSNPTGFGWFVCQPSDSRKIDWQNEMKRMIL